MFSTAETKAAALNLSTQRRKALTAAFYPFTYCKAFQKRDDAGKAGATGWGEATWQSVGSTQTLKPSQSQSSSLSRAFC